MMEGFNDSQIDMIMFCCVENQLINKSLLMHHLIFMECRKVARKTHKHRRVVRETLENLLTNRQSLNGKCSVAS